MREASVLAAARTLAFPFGAGMPIPKRYFHVSQEMNHDPELWHFTDTFGERALRTWLQVLVILDRSQNRWRITEGCFETLARTVRQYPKNVRRQVEELEKNQWLQVLETTKDGSWLVLGATNWLKYNRTQEHSGARKGAVADPLLSVPSLSVPIRSVPTPKDEEVKKEVKITRDVPKRSREAKSSLTWDSYKTAYEGRYGVVPLRNASSNSLLCQLVDKLGQDKAPAVAAYYLTHPSSFYATAGHSLTLLVRDAQKLLTESLTGQTITTTQARQDDGRAARGQMWQRLIDKELKKTEEGV